MCSVSPVTEETTTTVKDIDDTIFLKSIYQVGALLSNFAKTLLFSSFPFLRCCLGGSIFRVDYRLGGERAN